MISILIPTYNYNIDNLLNNLIYQIKTSNCNIEIIVCDDYSTHNIIKNFNLKNSNITLLKNEKNLGRTETRQILAEKAKNDWLLFLDADVLPCQSNFIINYLETIKKNNCDLVYGGFNYQKERPEKNKILRWTYGNKKEDIPLTKRSKKPYKTIISANILVKKNIFIEVNKEFTGNYYGYDNVFSIKLEEIKAKILHINNPVWHLGLETNETYLRKKEKSAQTVHHLYKLNKINSGSNDLLKAYEKLKKFKLIKLVGTIFTLINPLIKINLLSKSPSITLLNIYRLGYFCKLEIDDEQ